MEDEMKPLEVVLSQDQFNQLNRDFPRNEKSPIIGKRATKVVEYFFKNRNAECHFERPKNGADLRIRIGSKRIGVEIKGTADKNNAWNKLKVSSTRSYELLRKGLPLYRVLDVFSPKPKLLIMKYDRDFGMKKEPRWTLFCKSR